MAVDTESEHMGTSVSGIDRGMRDGAAIHAAALAAGFSTRLLPRQVLQVWSSDGGTASFTHGIPQSTTLAAVTYSQDLRMRRGLLGHEGIAQPRGATFSVGRGKKAARRFARQIGYPLVVKPALGDSTISVKRNVRNELELDEAFTELLRPLRDRPGHTEAAYGITELRKPGCKNGEETVPPGYRILVEEQISGRLVRALVLHGKILSLVHCPNGPWGPGIKLLEERGSLEGVVADVVSGVTCAIPGLKVSSIDLVIPDAPVSQGGGTRAFVVDLSERPWLEVQRRIAPQLADRLAQEVLESEVGRGAREAPRSKVNAHINFEGVVDPVAFVDVISDYAASISLGLELSVLDSALGHVGGSVAGSPHLLAETMEVIVGQGIRSQTATKAEVVQ